MTSEDLMGTLRDLRKNHFIDFKWHLQQDDILEGYAPIQEDCLENANRKDTVDLMVQMYSFPGAVKVTKTILKMMDRYDLVYRLNDTVSEAEGSSVQKHPTDLNVILMNLKMKIWTFVNKELVKFDQVLSTDYPGCLKRQSESIIDTDEEEQMTTCREAFLKITLDVLLKMKQENLANCLQSRIIAPVCQHHLKSNLKNKFRHVFEETKPGRLTPLNQIYTELFITKGGTVEANDDHEVRQIETALTKPVRPGMTVNDSEDIFKPSDGSNQPIRTVLTKGVAGIGKTVLTQKFTLDWAEDKANQDIQFTFPLTFRELNVLKDKRFTLLGLIHHFFPETKRISRFKEFQVVFILDGLDECRLSLNFHNYRILTDVTESNSVDVLLTNVIEGNLLPSARLWITTRPAAANQIPPKCVDMVTEVRGFTDLRKEEYFRKRCSKKFASRIISHIKTSQSLYIMCRIPVFCWITATVLGKLLKTRGEGELPKTLTEMYIHFLVFQTKVKNISCYGGAGMDPNVSPDKKKMVQSLGKLAFEQLHKGNLIFYESDLTESDINFRTMSVYSDVFSQIFIEKRGLYQEKMFCFVHLSVQEFLAALHVHLTFFNSGVNLLSEEPSVVLQFKKKVTFFYQTAVDKALQSSNGHLDLLLRFLVGLSLETNQTHLGILVTEKRSSSQANQNTIQYINKKIKNNLFPEKIINLFHCLNELNDRSLVEKIQTSLTSGSLSRDKLSPAQWSALVFILLSSEELDVFDLKKYSASEEALLRLLPVVKASNKALLDGCNLSKRSCEALSTVLSSQSSHLIELDLSNNNLKDSGVKLLSSGLENPHCRLEILRLSGCLITEEGCSSLASALSSNSSHLRELDLSYNHPGDSGVKLLFAGLQDPNWRLDTFRVENEVKWLKSGLRKYACELTLDTNPVHGDLRLSDNNRTVTAATEEQTHPEHPVMFDDWYQLQCTNSLTGRCYWEVEWGGDVCVSVLQRFVAYDQTWSLTCSRDGYHVCEDTTETSVPLCSVSQRVAVYVDCPAGTVSFYGVSSGKLIHLHTFNARLSGPLYAGFGFGSSGSSVTLCSV